MTAFVRCLQTCTAAAALFALLGACGLTPLSRGPRSPHPGRPRAAITIRSLTGVWVAVRETPAGRQAVSLSLVQNGNSLGGILTCGDRALASDPAQPAFLGTAGEFTIGFGRSHERIVVQARPDAGGDRLVASVRGLDREPVALIFTRS